MGFRARTEPPCPCRCGLPLDRWQRVAAQRLHFAHHDESMQRLSTKCYLIPVTHVNWLLFLFIHHPIVSGRRVSSSNQFFILHILQSQNILQLSREEWSLSVSDLNNLPLRNHRKHGYKAIPYISGVDYEGKLLPRALGAWQVSLLRHPLEAARRLSIFLQLFPQYTHRPRCPQHFQLANCRTHVSAQAHP